MEIEGIWNGPKERAMILAIGFGSGMEIEKEKVVVDSLHRNFAKFLAIPIGIIPLKFLSNPFNSTFQVKIPTSVSHPSF